MVNFPTWIPDCDSHSPVFLYSFISSDTAGACYIAVFSLLGNTDQVVSMSFLSDSKGGVHFHCIAFDYSCADWDSLGNHLRDDQWKDIFRVSAFAAAAAAELCEWVKVGIDVYLPQGKYQVKPHSSP